MNYRFKGISKYIENFEVSPPGAYSNLLGYQSVNVIDPSFHEFTRNFVVDDYYLTIFGTKLENLKYSVQYNKKYADGRTIWYTEVLGLAQINGLLDYLEGLDRRTERKLDVINAIRQERVDEEIRAHDEKINKLSKQVSGRFPLPRRS